MLAAVTEDDADDPGIETTRVRTDLIDRHPGDPGSMGRTVGIGPIAHRDPDIPGTSPTSARTGPRDYQATGDPGTRWTTMRVDPIDHLGPGDPETQRMTAVIDPPLRHGRQDWDKVWQRFLVAGGRTR